MLTWYIRWEQGDQKIRKNCQLFSKNSPKSCPVKKRPKLSTTRLNLKAQNTYNKPILKPLKKPNWQKIAQSGHPGWEHHSLLLLILLNTCLLQAENKLVCLCPASLTWPLNKLKLYFLIKLSPSVNVIKHLFSSQALGHK